MLRAARDWVRMMLRLARYIFIINTLNGLYVANTAEVSYAET